MKDELACRRQMKAFIDSIIRKRKEAAAKSKPTLEDFWSDFWK